MTTTLITERLTLTPVQLSDYDELVSLWGDPAFATAIFPAALSSEDVWFRLLRDIGHWEALGRGNWAIRETATGAYVGSVGVLDYHRIMEPAFDAPELGWGVAPRFQGQGMAFEAVSAALAETAQVRRSCAVAQRYGWRCADPAVATDPVVYRREVFGQPWARVAAEADAGLAETVWFEIRVRRP